MSDLWALLLAVGLAAPLFVVPAGVLFLTHLAWRRSRRQALRSPPGSPGEPRKDGFIAWGFLATALVLPWGMAIAAKLILQSRGEPTYPWSSFLVSMLTDPCPIPTTHPGSCSCVRVRSVRDRCF